MAAHAGAGAQVSGESVDDYKANVREGLRRLLDAPMDALGTAVEWVVAYVKPSTIDPMSKGPGKVRRAAQHTARSSLWSMGSWEGRSCRLQQ